MPEVRLAGRARQDLHELWCYVADRDLAAADRVVARILDVAKLYAQMPMMGRERPDLVPGLRFYPVDRYVVFYRHIATGILIDRILHASRDIDAEFSE